MRRTILAATAALALTTGIAAAQSMKALRIPRAPGPA